MNDVLSFSDLFILFPCLIAIVFTFVFYPMLLYVFGRLFMKKWPSRGILLWAMSGINLKKLPFYCPYDCSISLCKCWSCPNYSKHKLNK